MRTVFVMRTVYLLVVSAGLAACVAEWLSARTMYRRIVEQRTNGALLMMAANFVREELMRLTVQCLLLVVALCSMALTGTSVPYPSAAVPYLAVIQLCHLAVALLLSLAAMMNRWARLRIMDMMNVNPESEESR